MKGCIQIYTGNGKGKTTAALGVAIRAAGNGMSTLLLQFMKQGFDYSESKILKTLTPLITLEKYGDDKFVLEKRTPGENECAEIWRGIQRAEVAVAEGQYNIVIMDEICVACHFGLIGESALETVFRERFPSVELILTGRYAPELWLKKRI